MYCLFCCEISVGCLYICVAFFYFCCPKKQIESCKAFLDARTSVVSLWFFFFLLCSLVLRLHKLLVWCVSTLQLSRCTRRRLSLLFATQTFQLIVSSRLKRHLPNISIWLHGDAQYVQRERAIRLESTSGNYLLYIITTRIHCPYVLCAQCFTRNSPI